MFLEVTTLMCSLSSSTRQETNFHKIYHSAFHNIRGFLFSVEGNAQFIVSISEELVARLRVFQPASEMFLLSDYGD